MLRKYVFGNVLNTDAVVSDIDIDKGQVPYLTVSNDNMQFSYIMDEKDIVYGLGQNIRGINKRGWIYKSKCDDNPQHNEDVLSLYGAHNFLIVHGIKTFGLFFDCPGVITFDVGYTHTDKLIIEVSDNNFDLYVIEGKTVIDNNLYNISSEISLAVSISKEVSTTNYQAMSKALSGNNLTEHSDIKDIVKQFRHIIGRSYIAPKWGLGYGQSRWSYMSVDEIRDVASLHRDNNMPLDAIYMDIDYMERYKDFTVNEETFPNLLAFSKEMSELGIHLVPIIDAGVKIENAYDIYEEGVKGNYFCKDKDGSDFVAAVWPGMVHFPDVLNKDAREWFGSKYKVLLDQGIDGFWNDMNEPAIFYTDKSLKNVLDGVDKYKGKNLGVSDFWELRDSITSLANNPKDYESFYHNINGNMIRHDKVHNLYGYNMTRAAGEAFEELEPDKRILLFSRSSYIGMHRYGGIWTGDNKSWWSHLLLNIQMMPSLNMCGFIYSGADIGGFGADVTEDLLLRWLAFGIFTPLMRNHSALGTRKQEAYNYNNIKTFSNILGLRYMLLPYLYSEYMKASLNDDMYLKPLAFDYPEDEFASQVEDQLLLGESIMIAPVYKQNAKGRYIYLPEQMKLIKFISISQYTQEIIDQGHHYIDIALDEVAIFIRKGHMLPLSNGGMNIKDVDYENLKVFCFLDENDIYYELYDDDGYTKDYENAANYTKINISIDKKVRVDGTKKVFLVE